MECLYCTGAGGGVFFNTRCCPKDDGPRSKRAAIRKVFRIQASQCKQIYSISGVYFRLVLILEQEKVSRDGAGRTAHGAMASQSPEASHVGECGVDDSNG